MAQQKDEPLIYAHVHRSLSETGYLVRLWIFKLTESDVLIVTIAGFGFAMIVQQIGLGESKVFGLKLDPMGAIAVAGIVALILSLAHRFRPEGNIDNIFKGLFARKAFAPRTRWRDRSWMPAVRIFKDYKKS